MRERLTFEREVRIAPSLLAELEAPMVEGELPPRVRPSAAIFEEFKKLDEVIKSKVKSVPGLADAPYLAITKRDRSWVWYRGEKEPRQFPIQIWSSTAGFYYFLWSDTGKIGHVKAGPNKRLDILDLMTGIELTKPPVVNQVLAGSLEAQELRKRARRGVVWVQVTVAETPPATTFPDEFPLHKSRSVSREEAEKELAFPLSPLIIPYPTGDLIEPRSYRGKPLNFTYYSHNGLMALVSRKLLDEEYYFFVSISELQDYLRFYAIGQAGKAGQGFVILFQIVGEIGIYFVPIIGPIYGLYQAGKSAHNLITNWDKLSGWEKALNLTDIVFAKFDVIKGVRAANAAVKGSKAAKAATEGLIRAGLPLSEAQNLMSAAEGAMKQGKKFTAVMELGALISTGKRLNPEQLTQVMIFYELLLKQLKPADRLLAEAAHATHDLATAKKFFLGLELTEAHRKGLSRLDPETLVRLRKAAKDEGVLVLDVAAIASRSEVAAAAMIKLSQATRPAHYHYVVIALGENVLTHLGSGSIVLHPGVIAAAKKARKSTDAIKILTQGVGKLAGTSELLWKRMPAPANLLAVADRFRKRGIFLNELQLTWFSNRSKSLQDVLAAAPEHDLAKLINSVDNQFTTAAITRYTDDLLAVGVKPSEIPGVLNRVGGRLLGKVEELGVRIDPDLFRAATKETIVQSKKKVKYPNRPDIGAKAQIILNGSKTPKVTGLLELLAAKLDTAKDLQTALAKVDLPRTGGDLYAHWILRQAKQLKAGEPYSVAKAELFGIAAIAKVRPKDAQDVIARIHLGFDVPENVLKTLGEVTHLRGNPEGMSAIIGDLAASGDKAAGALFVLDFARNSGHKAISHIERVVEDTVRRGLGRKIPVRKYDLVADGIHYEMKYWSEWTGRKVDSAVDEFMRDIVQHAGNGFANLRWVFNDKMKAFKPQIIDSMLGAFKNRWVRASLQKKDVKDVAKVIAELKKKLWATDGFLIFR
jgi:hypothetical protein